MGAKKEVPSALYYPDCCGKGGRLVERLVPLETLVAGVLQRECLSYADGVMVASEFQLYSILKDRLPPEVGRLDFAGFNRLLMSLPEMMVGERWGYRSAAQDETEDVYWEKGQYLRETFGLTIKRRRSTDHARSKWTYTITFDGAFSA